MRAWPALSRAASSMLPSYVSEANERTKGWIKSGWVKSGPVPEMREH